MRRVLSIIAIVGLVLPTLCTAQKISVVDQQTGAPVEDPTITVDGRVILGSALGLPGNNRIHTIAVRAPGYQRTQIEVQSPIPRPTLEVHLRPMNVDALYLTEYGIASPFLRNGALAVIQRGGACALVITIKTDRGKLAFPSEIPLAKEIGATKGATIHSLPDLVTLLHGQGIYLVARIVTFKDDVLAQKRPELAVHTGHGKMYRDREKLAWTNPFNNAVRRYNIAVAREAAEAGFDEVQFDYVRFPDSAEKMDWGRTITQADRVDAISSFLREAREMLAPYNVFLSVDVFGYTLWNKGDTGIGQQLENIAAIVDYVCPMLYPSGFQFGIPAHRNPVETDDDVYQTIRLSLEEACRRTHVSSKHFRPWIQGFRDYAFNRRDFAAHEVALQTKAARDAKTSGWALWNARNRYEKSGL